MATAATPPSEGLSTGQLLSMQGNSGMGGMQHGASDNALINNAMKPIPGLVGGLSMGGKGLLDMVSGGISQVNPTDKLLPPPPSKGGVGKDVDIMGPGH